MKKIIKITAIILVVAITAGICTVFMASKGKVKIKIDASVLSDEISDPVSNVNVWDMGESFYKVQANENGDPFEFVKYVQLMQCTGGTLDRDLFKNPADTSVLDDYDFSRLIKNCKGILKLGAKPHLKLGGVPVKYTSGAEMGGFDMNVYPPDDYEVYYNYIKAMAEALVKSFGKKEVRKWHFGCMTEYENSDWFQAKSGDPKESAEAYCKLYDYTVAALTDVLDEDIFVGAHSMSVTEGLWDEKLFIEHIAKGTNYKTGKIGTPVKFLSASFYDSRPGEYTSGKTLPETINYIRSTAEQNGLNDLVYGVDEGRILSGNSSGSTSDALLNRTCGYTWQAAYDARLYKQCIDNDISYFSSWGYHTGGLLSGYPIISYHVAKNISEFSGCKKVSVTTGGLKKLLGVEADCVAAFDEKTNTLRVMMYNFKNDVEYKDAVHFELSFNVPQFDGEELSITVNTVDDDCNFFDEWQDDRKKYGITDDKFSWSPDDPCIDSEVTLADKDARNTYFAELRDRYIKYAVLTPSKTDSVVRNSTFAYSITLGASNVVFLEIKTK